MTDLLRQEIATTAHLLVVKVGTRVLTHKNGVLNDDAIARLGEQISQVEDTGRRVVLVSSGAVGAGMNGLGLQRRPTDLAQLQAVAAVGQTKLIEAYDRTFRRHGRHAAQLLLTADDLNDRTRYLNVRNTLLSLLQFGAIPVINENDTVAVDELMTTFGDNDRLAAIVTNLLRAPLLVILSDVEGLYSGDPRATGSNLISTVTTVDHSILGLVHDETTGLSKGGMASKLDAASMVTAAGENVLIASGHRPGVLCDIIAGQTVGTLFLAQGKSVSPWKRWIGFSAQPKGSLIVDTGARQAIVADGRSLLAIGIAEVRGDFVKGDVVAIRDLDGQEIARGLTNYAVAEIRQIMGLKSDRIAQVLGHCPYKEVIHRDNLAVV